MSTVPTFETDRLILREPDPSCFKDWHEGIVDWEVARFFAETFPWPYPDDGVPAHYEEIKKNQGKKMWYWAIFTKENPETMIGSVEIRLQDGFKDRGFWIRKKDWGKGYMTEAVVVINDYAFNVLGWQKLTLRNAIENKGSARVKEKTGARFIKEVDGTFLDPLLTREQVWELTAEDWRAYKEKAGLV